jgi:hypothetical protein
VSLRRDYTASPGSAAVLERSVDADYYYIEALLRLKGIFLE